MEEHQRNINLLFTLAGFSYIREVYEDYNGLETLTEVEQIENGYSDGIA